MEAGNLAWLDEELPATVEEVGGEVEVVREEELLCVEAGPGEAVQQEVVVLVL